MSSVGRVMLWGGVAIVGTAGAVAAANNIRFQHRVHREVREMLASAAHTGAIDRGALERLPDPVRRYLTKAIGARRTFIHSARLRQDGTFRPDLKGRWYPLTGEQYFTADSPGFIWWGRVRPMPGIWMEARDRSVRGAGNMLVVAESTVTLNDARGPELDQGALLRLLGELAWVPTVYLDDRYVRWTAIDDRRAKATLAVEGREVVALFEFGDDDLPARFRAERFRDLGGGKSELTPFLGEYHDYRDVDGVIVPHEMVGSWIIDGTPMPYARFRVAAIEFDTAAPFSRGRI
ncbi:MAG: hypothetical protein ND807_10545 [Vicinamibacterales bacterium]|nr:hypothetical protein [Vicinamibacterales bacterium]